MIISYSITSIMTLVGLAYYTLLERKILSYIQTRRGPNKVGVMGLIQPMADGVKLFTKETLMPYHSDMALYMIIPAVGLCLYLMQWTLAFYYNDHPDSHLGSISFLVISAMSVYTVIMAGWSSNSSYASMGATRAIAQTISYEVVMALVIITIMIQHNSFSMESMKNHPHNSITLLLLPMWVSIIMAETNRSPYDFAEGESELVSGFNVEYSSISFSLLFMAEYGTILFSAYLTDLSFTPQSNGLTFLLTSLIVIWARGTLPRYRYDKLSYSTWKGYLPLTLSMILISAGTSMLPFIGC